MDVARCLCPHDSDGKKCGRHPSCPFHGITSASPSVVYFLTVGDKKFLRGLRIDPEDSAEIQQIRQADEDRFK